MLNLRVAAGLGGRWHHQYQAMGIDPVARQGRMRHGIGKILEERLESRARKVIVDSLRFCRRVKGRAIGIVNFGQSQIRLGGGRQSRYSTSGKAVPGTRV